MILTAYPKINLGLDILFRRPDGYHEIDTLMVQVPCVSDRIELLPAEGGGCNLQIEGLNVDCAADRNLVVKVWMLMREVYGIGGVNIRLEKHIPFGAGLGGGSADAAVAIKGFNELFDLRLTTEQMVGIAERLGSDIPFFIHSQPMFCRGRGEVMSPAKVDLSGVWCVISKPSFGISTAEAYAGVAPHIPDLSLEERLRLPRAEWQSAIRNDFEPSLFDKYTALPNIKREMQRCGAFYASLSGSGSAMYGLFDKEPNYKPIFAGEEVFVCRLA